MDAYGIYGYNEATAYEIWLYGYDGNQGQGIKSRAYAGTLPRVSWIFNGLSGGYDNGYPPAFTHLKEMFDSGYVAVTVQPSDVYGTSLPHNPANGIQIGSETLVQWLARTKTPIILWDVFFAALLGDSISAGGSTLPCYTLRGSPGAGSHIGNGTDCSLSVVNPAKDVNLRSNHENYLSKTHVNLSQYSGAVHNLTLTGTDAGSGWSTTSVNDIVVFDPNGTPRRFVVSSLPGGDTIRATREDGLTTGLTGSDKPVNVTLQPGTFVNYNAAAWLRDSYYDFLPAELGNPTGWQTMHSYRWMNGDFGDPLYQYLNNQGCVVTGWWSDWEDMYLSFGDQRYLTVNSSNGLTGTYITIRQLFEQDSRLGWPSSSGWDMDPEAKVLTSLAEITDSRSSVMENIAKTWPAYDPNSVSVYDRSNESLTPFTSYSDECNKAFGRNKDLMEIYGWNDLGRTGKSTIIGWQLNNFTDMMSKMGRLVVKSYNKGVHNFDVWITAGTNFWNVPSTNPWSLVDNSNPQYGYSFSIAQTIGLLKAAYAMGTIKTRGYNPGYAPLFTNWAQMIALDEMQEYADIIKYGTNYIPPSGSNKGFMTGNNLSTEDPHLYPVTAVKQSRGSSYLATRDSNGSFKLWNYSTKNLQTYLYGGSQTFSYNADKFDWSPDDAHIGINSNPLRFINTTDSLMTVDYSVNLSGYPSIGGVRPKSISFNPTLTGSNEQVAVAIDNKIQIYQIRTSTLQQTLTPGYTISYNACYSTDGTLLAVSGDNKIDIYQVSGWSHVRTLTHSGNVQWIGFNSTHTRIISASSDKTIKIWNTSDGSLVKTITSSDAFSDVAFSDTYISAACSDYVYIWNYNGTVIQSFRTPMNFWEHHDEYGTPYGVTFSGSGNNIIVGTGISATAGTYATNGYGVAYEYKISDASVLKIFNAFNILRRKSWASTCFYSKDYDGNELPDNYWICCRTYGTRMMFFGFNDGTSTVEIYIKSPAGSKELITVSPTGSVTLI